MNKRKLAFASIACFALASCDVSEVYPGDAYVDSVFINNLYDHYDDGLKEARESSNELITLQNGEHGYFNGSGNYDRPSSCIGFNQAKSYHPSYFQNADGSELDWSHDLVSGVGVGDWADQSPLYGISYSQTKKLSRLHDGFREGYLSKLYNGQIKCNAWGYYSMVVLGDEGYGTLFPAELTEASYFAFVARGGSDTPDSHTGRVSSFDINVTFYKYGDDLSTLQGTTIKLDDVKLQTNYSAEVTALVGFTFEDIGFDPSGIVGMSIDFESEDYYQGERISSDFSDGEEYHIGLMMLEVLFPDSTWN